MTLLVLLARAAPARFVAPDPGPGRGEPRAHRSAGRPGRHPGPRARCASGRRGGPRTADGSASPAAGWRSAAWPAASGARGACGMVAAAGRGAGASAPSSAAPAPAATRAGWPGPGSGTVSGSRRTVTRKMVVATWRRIRSAQLLVEAERLLAELVERILLGVAAQADAPAHVVELGEVLDPQAVDRAQQHEPLHLRPDLVAVLLLAAPRGGRPPGRGCTPRARRGTVRPRPAPPRRSPGRRGPSRAARPSVPRGSTRPATSPPRYWSPIASTSSSRNPRTVSVRSSLRRTLSRSA